MNVNNNEILLVVGIGAFFLFSRRPPTVPIGAGATTPTGMPPIGQPYNPFYGAPSQPMVATPAGGYTDSTAQQLAATGSLLKGVGSAFSDVVSSGSDADLW
jgi:hypothetical protein